MCDVTASLQCCRVCWWPGQLCREEFGAEQQVADGVEPVVALLWSRGRGPGYFPLELCRASSGRSCVCLLTCINMYMLSEEISRWCESASPWAHVANFPGSTHVGVGGCFPLEQCWGDLWLEILVDCAHT